VVEHKQSRISRPRHSSLQSRYTNLEAITLNIYSRSFGANANRVRGSKLKEMLQIMFIISTILLVHYNDLKILIDCNLSIFHRSAYFLSNDVLQR